MTDHLDIRPVSGLDRGQDELFRAWAVVLEADGRHTFGDAHSSRSLEELREVERGTERHRLAWVALDPAGTVVASASLTMPQHDNLSTAGLSVVVHPSHRRRGIGTAMLRHVEDQARAQQRPVLMAETQWPVGAGDESGEGFASRQGYAVAQTAVRSVLSLPPDVAAFERLVAAHDGDGYVLRTAWDGLPDAWLPGRAELSRRMSTDIPWGDLQLEEEVWDEQRVRESYERIAGMGRRVVDTVALEVSTGRLVGYTQVQLPRGSALGYQQDTVVLREHRGHGLGLRLKAATALAIVAEVPEVTRVRTWNADDNVHMLAVNSTLGYEADAWMREWQKVL